MTRGQVRFFFSIVIIAAIVLIAVWIRNRYVSAVRSPQEQAQRSARGERQDAETRPAERRDRTAPAIEGTPEAATRPAPSTSVSVSPADRAEADALLEKGLELASQDRLVAARAALADALNTNALPDQQDETVRRKLIDLANRTLFCREILEDDPCTDSYLVKPGDVLVRVERALKLRVPTQLILKINGIADDTKVRAGRKLKVIRGPFHAVVFKGRFLLDVYLTEPKTGRMIFVRRFPVGTGKDGATPIGRWRVARGGKIIKPEWTPPFSSGMPRAPIPPGDPRYPLGKKGYWISLEGAEGNPYTQRDGYGIHCTKDPDSVGKAASMGCIRLRDEDMEELFFMLYERWSGVTILP